MTTCTRILYAQCAVPADMKRLKATCRNVGKMRAAIWQRWGGLGTVGKSVNEVRREITAANLFEKIDIDGTVRAESTKDIVNDIFAYRKAAEAAVVKKICKRYKDDAECKVMCGKLRNGEWLKDPYLHRQMRTHFRHGKGKCSRQFVVRSDKYLIGYSGGFLTITLLFNRKSGGPVTLVTTTNGTNVKIANRNLRIIIENDEIQVHYAFEKVCKRPHGEETVGVDKGLTEAFATTTNELLGQGLGKLVFEYSDAITEIWRGRNKLRALAERYEKEGKTEKANNIRLNNLGTKKLDNMRRRFRTKVRNLLCKAAHKLMDRACVIVVEDLSGFIKGKSLGRKTNRRLRTWVKGVMQEILEEIAALRDVRIVIVNGAYTSQTDSQTGAFTGERKGDRFYRENGDIVHADLNAAFVILLRLWDPEITRYMGYREVKKIIEARTAGYRDAISSGGTYWPSRGFNWMQPTLEKAARTLVKCGKKSENTSSNFE